MTMLQHGLVPSTGGYQIERSLRFNSADSAYLSRTPGSAGNRKTWTLSAWVKRSKLSSISYWFSAGAGGSDSTYLSFTFNGSDQLNISLWNFTPLLTTQVFRDTSAWYHIVVAVDTTQATASNRMKLYVNGSEVTAFSTDSRSSISQNTDLAVNNNAIHEFGRNAYGSNYYSDIYLTDVHLVDGSALTPSSFGENDTDTGVWKPKAYTGSYGTNGFKLTFSDNSGTTSTTLGKDTSGNGNNWTPNNFSVTAGAGNDSLVDTPTPYGTDTGAGGEVRGNYCTLNPLKNASALSDGNLKALATASSWQGAVGTIGVSSGKWYWEVTKIGTDYTMVGIANASVSTTETFSTPSNSWTYFSPDGNKFGNGTGGTGTVYGASYTNNDVIGVALDLDAGTLVFYKNGVSQGTAYSSLSGTLFPFVSNYTNNVGLNINFGQRPFAYTAPSGFKALCTQNLPTPTIGATSSTRADDYFNTVLWTGTGSTQSITGVGFQPDFVWMKARNNTYNNWLFDSVRGTGKLLASNTTDAESSTYPNILSAFNSDGFTTDSFGSTYNFVGWNWKANGAGSSNTAGSITSTVSANTTAGFSIVTYTGNGLSNATFGHGLGVTPSMIIVKRRGVDANHWAIYHSALGPNKYIYLNLTQGTDTVTGLWGSSGPSSSLVYLPTGTAQAEVNASGGTYVAYCFAPVAGYSAFGSYTGNGSADGPFVYLGFRPAYILVKRTDDVANWPIMDQKRLGYNVSNEPLYANLSNAEGTATFADFLSNGFKLRSTSNNVNTSAGTYIYAAFAEVPQKFSLAR